MRLRGTFIAVVFAGAALGGCQTGGINEGPVEYANRPDYRSAPQPLPPPPARYPRGGYDRYGQDDGYGDRGGYRDGGGRYGGYRDPCLSDPNYDPRYDRCSR